MSQLTLKLRHNLAIENAELVIIEHLVSQMDSLKITQENKLDPELLLALCELTIKIIKDTTKSKDKAKPLLKKKEAEQINKEAVVLSAISKKFNGLTQEDENNLKKMIAYNVNHKLLKKGFLRSMRKAFVSLFSAIRRLL